MFGGNVEIIGVSQMYEMSINLYFMPKGRLTHPLTVLSGQVVTE